MSDGNSPFTQAFQEVAEALYASLVDLGYDSVLITGAPPAGRRSIVFGANLANLRSLIPADAILYNMEQVGSYWFTPELVVLYRTHTVWEYSAANAARYAEPGLLPLGSKRLSKPVVVPFGYHPCLSHIERKPKAERDIDVLHVGSMNDRRKAVLDKLEARGFNVVRLFAVFGAERDAYYARAKVVLNIHYHEAAIFEAARVHYCAANNICVVSENSAANEGSDVCMAVPYEELEDAVAELVVSPVLCEAHEQVAFENLKRKPMRRYVQHGLAMRAAPVIQAALAPKQTIVLCMIVKNESKVIQRCLASVRPFITHWCIVDTGSTDGTQDLVRTALSDLPGELLEHPWTREDTNRTQALDAARKLGEYVLWIDADEVFSADPLFVMPQLTADSYDITVRWGVEYARVQLIRSRLPWRWIGRVHPYLEAEGSGATAKLEGVYTTPYPDGASWSDADKYKKHIQLLLEDVQEDPNNARSRYYLAQSYRDAGQPIEAAEHYAKRATMLNGWEEERWSAAYEYAKIQEKLKKSLGEVVAAYTNAWCIRTTRSEPLHALACYLNWSGRPDIALMFARQAASLPLPPDRLFIEAEVYAWKALDEWSLAAANSGRAGEAREVFRRLMQVAPPSAMPRLLENKKHIDP